MRKSCLLFTCLYRMLTHCFQQEETVLPRFVPNFLLLEYLQVSQMMIFEVACISRSGDKTTHWNWSLK
ncbi:hypothetical protein ACB092_12G218100 [Castanea dentata]